MYRQELWAWTRGHLDHTGSISASTWRVRMEGMNRLGVCWSRRKIVRLTHLLLCGELRSKPYFSDSFPNLRTRWLQRQT